MAITRKRKEQQVADLKEKLGNLKAAVITNYSGFSVADMQELRKNLRAEKIDYKIIKNSLIKLALKDTDIEIDPDIFKGQIAIAYGYDDEVMPAKLVYEIAKTNEKPEILGGIFEGKYIDKDKTENLAQIPGREQLYGQLVSVIAGPMIGLQNVLQGNIRGLVSVINQYKEQKA